MMGKCNATGICDSRAGFALIGMKDDEGEAGGEVLGLRVAVLTGVGLVAGGVLFAGVLTTFAVEGVSSIDCDFARRGMADCVGEDKIPGMARKMALVKTRSISDRSAACTFGVGAIPSLLLFLGAKSRGVVLDIQDSQPQDTQAPDVITH